MQNLLGGLIQVQLFMLQSHYRDFIWGGPCKEEKKRIEVANGVEVEAEAIEDLSIELVDGFVLKLSDVLYVPSLRRNLISVSCLDDDGYDCHFGNNKYRIVINNKCVGLAFWQDELYLVSLCENEKVVNTENASSSMNARNKQKRVHDVSSKLWHYRLYHILRGRIEWLIKKSILLLLEFLDLEQCIDCIKGNMLRK